MKVVINACYGGFSLSPEATLELWKRGGPVEATPVDDYFKTDSRFSLHSTFGKQARLDEWRRYLKGEERAGAFLTVFSPDESLVLNVRVEGKDRSNPLLVAVVEELGDAANGACAKLRVVEIPDGVDFTIEEYDGNEHVAETHRVWS